jgi:fatty acid synthase
MILLGSQAQRMYSCLDTIDKCLQTSASCVLSYVKAEKGGSDLTGNETIDILNVITRLLGLKDVSNIDPETTLGQLGVDSLIAVEIKQALDKTLEVQTSVKEVRDLTIARLIEISSEQFAQKTAPAPTE